MSEFYERHTMPVILGIFATFVTLFGIVTLIAGISSTFLADMIVNTLAKYNIDATTYMEPLDLDMPAMIGFIVCGLLITLIGIGTFKGSKLAWFMMILLIVIVIGIYILTFIGSDLTVLIDNMIARLSPYLPPNVISAFRYQHIFSAIVAALCFLYLMTKGVRGYFGFNVD